MHHKCFVSICAWCGSDRIKNEISYPAARIDLYRCRKCGTLFRGPEHGKINYNGYTTVKRNDEEEFQRPDAYYDTKMQGRFLLKRLERACNLGIKKPFSILDIGAGEGTFLAEVRAKYPGAVLCGLDPSADHIEAAARNYGIELIQGYWEGISDRKYDIVTIFGNLMLHPLPKKSLRLAVDCLAAEGLILFDFKNPYSGTRRLLRRFCAFFPESSLKQRLYRQTFHGMPWGLAETPMRALVDELGLEIVSVRHAPGRNIEIGAKKGRMMRMSAAIDRLFGSEAWIEFVARRREVAAVDR